MRRPIRVLFVCLGNICRSPLAEGLCLAAVHHLGVGHRFEIASAGTAAYHTGELPDPRTRSLLERRGIQLRTRARRVTPTDLAYFDYVLAMDETNLRTLRSQCLESHRHKLYRVLDVSTGGDVEDPYYGGLSGFDRNAADLDVALAAWIERWLTDHGSDPA